MIITKKIPAALAVITGICFLAIITGYAPSFHPGISDSSANSVANSDQAASTVGANQTSDINANYEDALCVDGYGYSLNAKAIVFKDEYGDIGEIIPSSGILTYELKPDFALNDSFMAQLKTDEPDLHWDISDGRLCGQLDLSFSPDAGTTASLIQGASMVFFARSHPNDPRAKEIFDLEKQDR